MQTCAGTPRPFPCHSAAAAAPLAMAKAGTKTRRRYQRSLSKVRMKESR
ncbi:MAG: hypothetical protein ACOX6T_06010 [Myxococcales bacterium]